MRVDRSDRVVYSCLAATFLVAVLSRLTAASFIAEAGRFAGVALFFFWPGFLCLRRLGWRPALPALSILSLATGLSMALWYGTGILVFLLRPPILVALALGVGLVYGVAIVLDRTRVSALSPTPPAGPSGEKIEWWWAGGLACPAALLVAVWPLRMDFVTLWDAGYFLTIARKFAELDTIEIVNAHVYDAQVDRGYGFNVYLLAVGLLGRFLNQDVLAIWGNLSLYGMAVVFSALFLLSSRLFGSVKIGLAVLGFLTFSYVSTYYTDPPCQYANPKVLTRSLALVFLWSFLELCDRPAWKNRIAFAALGAPILAIHPFGLMVGFCYVGGAFLFTAVTDGGERRVRILRESLLGGALLTLFAAPYLGMKLYYLFESNSPLFTLEWDFLDRAVQRFLTLVSIDRTGEKTRVIGYIADPSLFLHSHPRFAWFGLPLLFVLYKKRLGLPRLHANLLVGGILLILSISLNPWVYPYFAKFWTVDLTGRLIRHAPVLAIGIVGTLALLLGALWNAAERRGARAGVVLVLCVVVAAPAFRRADRVSKYFTEAYRTVTPDLDSWLRVRYPDILNDPFFKALRNRGETDTPIFNTTRMVEQHLFPLVNARAYDLFKENWVSMDMTWAKHVERKAVVDRFLASKSQTDRIKTLWDLGLTDLIAEGQVDLDWPLFETLEESEKEGGKGPLTLRWIRTRSKEEIETTLQEMGREEIRPETLEEAAAIWNRWRQIEETVKELSLQPVEKPVVRFLQEKTPEERTLSDWVLADALTSSTETATLDSEGFEGNVSRVSTLESGTTFDPRVEFRPEPSAKDRPETATLFDGNPTSGYPKSWWKTGFNWNSRRGRPIAVRVEIEYEDLEVLAGLKIHSLKARPDLAPQRLSIETRSDSDARWELLDERDWPEAEEVFELTGQIVPSKQIRMEFHSDRDRLILTDIEFQFWKRN